MRQDLFFVVLAAIITLLCAASFIAAIIVWRGLLNLLLWGFFLWGCIIILRVAIAEYERPISRPDTEVVS